MTYLLSDHFAQSPKKRLNNSRKQSLTIKSGPLLLSEHLSPVGFGGNLSKYLMLTSRAGFWSRKQLETSLLE